MDPALIGVLGTLLGVLAAGVLSHIREKANREHALKLKKVELEGQREQKWLDDRKEAYADLAKVTSVIGTDKYVIGDLFQALGRVQMVSNSTRTTNIAVNLVAVAQRARKRTSDIRKQGKKISEDEEARALVEQSREAYAAFIAAVQTELYGAAFDEAYGRWAIGKEDQPAQLEE